MIEQVCPECGKELELFDHDDEDGNFNGWELTCECGYTEEDE